MFILGRLGSGCSASSLRALHVSRQPAFVALCWMARKSKTRGKQKSITSSHVFRECAKYRFSFLES